MSTSDRKAAFLESAGLQVKGNVLFHGTSPENAESIMREGFRTDAEERHGKSGGEGVYLHHDPQEAAKYGPTMVVVRKGGGPLANWHEMLFDTMRGSHSSQRYPDLSREERTAKYLKDYGHPGYKDPDDKSTIITDPSVLRPIATSHSGQCPTCLGEGFHHKTGQSCPTCSGRGVMW